MRTEQYIQTSLQKNRCLTAELEQERCYTDKQRKTTVNDFC